MNKEQFDLLLQEQKQINERLSELANAFQNSLAAIEANTREMSDLILEQKVSNSLLQKIECSLTIIV